MEQRTSFASLQNRGYFLRFSGKREAGVEHETVRRGKALKFSRYYFSALFAAAFFALDALFVLCTCSKNAKTTNKQTKALVLQATVVLTGETKNKLR